MKTEDFVSDDFLKQFKTGEQLNDFLADMPDLSVYFYLRPCYVA